MSTIKNSINLNGYTYYFSDLVKFDIKSECRLLTSNEIEILKFCQCWLNGDMNFIINTSGSTGEPKPIVITRKQMIISAKLTGEALNLNQGDTSLICLPAKYIAGKMMLVRGFVLGLKMTIVEPSRDPFAGLNNNEYFDFTALVPTQLEMILKSPRSIDFLNSMKAVLIGGAPISSSLQKKVCFLKASIFHSYGMTETVSHIALCKLNDSKNNNSFFPLKDVEIGVDTNSCLNIRSPVTENKLIQTNDKVRILENGSFTWLGRKDNVFVTPSGKKVQIEKIENSFRNALFSIGNKYLFDLRFVIFRYIDSKHHGLTYVVIEGNNLGVNIEKKIKKYLDKKLEKHEIPDVFFYLKWLPETETGKINKKEIYANLKKIS